MTHEPAQSLLTFARTDEITVSVPFEGSVHCCALNTSIAAEIGL